MVKLKQFKLQQALRRRAETSFPEAGKTDSAHVIPRPLVEESPAPKTGERPGPATDAPKPAVPGTPHFVRSDMASTHVIPKAPAEESPTPRGDMPAATPTPPDRLTITTPIHLELIRIPAGEFLMGSDPKQDKNARPDEQPRHRVYLSNYYIGQYPITNAQYAAFVKAQKHRAPDHWKDGQIPPSKENHPIVYVTWDDAVAFCQWLSRETGQAFRLPTEAEWEKAARGADGRIYPWGAAWDKTRLNSIEGGPSGTTPVGQYSPGGDSSYGAADMVGNVWEWCADWYDAQAYQRRAEGEVRDPTGPDKGDYRVVRGGAFDNDASWARCAARFRSRFIWDGGLRVVVGGPFPTRGSRLAGNAVRLLAAPPRFSGEVRSLPGRSRACRYGSGI